MLSVLGSSCYFLIPKEQRHKLDLNGEKGTLIGYATEAKGYNTRFPRLRKVIQTRDVITEEVKEL